MSFAVLPLSQPMSAVRSRRHSFRRLVPFLVVLLAGAGCATATGGKPKIHPAAGAPEQRFTLSGAGFQTTALITPQGAQGPETNLGRYDGGKAIRGTAFGRSLDLSLTETGASGIWGQGPLTLNISETAPEEMKVTGLIAGRPSNFTASTQTINGTIGLCSYDLSRSGGESYVGSRSCGGGISQVTAEFPSTILSWRPIDIAALMALLMSAP
jgi:hypothetical protein